MNSRFPWEKLLVLLGAAIGVMAYGEQTKDVIGSFGALTLVCSILAAADRDFRMPMSFFITLYGGGTIFAIGSKLGIALPALACLAYWGILFVAAYQIMMAVFRYQRNQETTTRRAVQVV